MRSAFFREEGIDGAADVHNTGTAAASARVIKIIPESWILQSKADWLR